MKKLFLIALLAIPVLAGTSCNNDDDNTDSCLVGEWKTTVNATGTPCDMIIEYKSNGTGTIAIKDCSDYCNQVGQGTHENLNYSTFSYTVANTNEITQTIQGQVIVCGTGQGASNTTTNGTFTCSGNTLTSTSSGGGTVTLTRM